MLIKVCILITLKQFNNFQNQMKIYITAALLASTVRPINIRHHTPEFLVELENDSGHNWGWKEHGKDWPQEFKGCGIGN